VDTAPEERSPHFKRSLCVASPRNFVCTRVFIFARPMIAITKIRDYSQSNGLTTTRSMESTYLCSVNVNFAMIQVVLSYSVAFIVRAFIYTNLVLIFRRSRTSSFLWLFALGRVLLMEPSALPLFLFITTATANSVLLFRKKNSNISYKQTNKLKSNHFENSTVTHSSYMYNSRQWKMCQHH